MTGQRDDEGAGGGIVAGDVMKTNPSAPPPTWSLSNINVNAKNDIRIFRIFYTFSLSSAKNRKTYSKTHVYRTMHTKILSLGDKLGDYPG